MTKDNTQVATTFEFLTDYGKKYVIFIELWKKRECTYGLLAEYSSYLREYSIQTSRVIQGHYVSEYDCIPHIWKSLSNNLFSRINTLTTDMKIETDMITNITDVR